MTIVDEAMHSGTDRLGHVDLVRQNSVGRHELHPLNCSAECNVQSVHSEIAEESAAC